MWICSCLRNFFGFLAQSGCSRPSEGFDRIRKPIWNLGQVLKENGILRLKNENPCFKNFSRVSGSWFHLGGGEESQGFLEVRNSKYQNGVFTMSSPDLNISITILCFPIG